MSNTEVQSNLPILQLLARDSMTELCCQDRHPSLVLDYRKTVFQNRLLLVAENQNGKTVNERRTPPPSIRHQSRVS